MISLGSVFSFTDTLHVSWPLVTPHNDLNIQMKFKLQQKATSHHTPDILSNIEHIMKVLIRTENPLNLHQLRIIVKRFNVMSRLSLIDMYKNPAEND